jgi:hypothetical protein
MTTAEVQLETLADLGPDFHTHRELIDAQANAWLANVLRRWN